MNLKRIREQAGLTQEQLALHCGFETSAISHWETGRRRPNLRNAGILASALNVSIDELLSVSRLAPTFNKAIMVLDPNGTEYVGYYINSCFCVVDQKGVLHKFKEQMDWRYL